MAYIYKIVNSLNSKVYIGQTLIALDRRFNQHLQDSVKERYINRPLYVAMNDLGKENFSIELIEETDIPNEREKHYIRFYDSKENGYNATTGGQGRGLLDFDKIYQLHLLGKSITDICNDMGCSRHWVYRVLKEQGKNVRQGKIKQIEQYDLEDNYIATYESVAKAAEAVGANRRSNHIGCAALGKRKTAHGFKWKYTKIES